MSPKRLFYILCGFLSLMIIAGGYGYYMASQNLSQGAQVLSERLADSQADEDMLAKLGDLEKQYERLEPTLPLINNALPAQKDETRVGLQLRNIAAASGMTLDNMTFPASTAPGPISQTTPVGSALAMEVNFQLKGTYEQLHEFLQRQEALDRYTSVTSLTINSEPGKPLSFSINLSVFLKP